MKNRRLLFKTTGIVYKSPEFPLQIRGNRPDRQRRKISGFVEVKYRHTSGSGGASAAVNYKKQKMISRASLFYLVRYGYPEDTPCRFDVVAIDGQNIQWIKNAFDYCG